MIKAGVGEGQGYELEIIRHDHPAIAAKPHLQHFRVLEDKRGRLREKLREARGFIHPQARFPAAFAAR